MHRSEAVIMPHSSIHRKGHSLALFNDTIRLGIYQTPCFCIIMLTRETRYIFKIKYIYMYHLIYCIRSLLLVILFVLWRNSRWQWNLTCNFIQLGVKNYLFIFLHFIHFNDTENILRDHYMFIYIFREILNALNCTNGSAWHRTMVALLLSCEQ